MAKVEKGQFVALGLDEFKHEWYMESMDSQVSGADCNSAQKLYSSREFNII